MLAFQHFNIAIFALGLILSPFSIAQAQAVKLSENGICHAYGGDYYEDTKNFTPYRDMASCRAAGGRTSEGRWGNGDLTEPLSYREEQSTIGNRVSNTLYGDEPLEPETEELTRTQSNTNPRVKKSVNDICHEIETRYYNSTRNFEPYPTMDACIASGGRLPEGEGRQTASSGPFGRIDNVFTRPNPDESIEGVTIRYGFPVIADNFDETISNFSLSENQ